MQIELAEKAIFDFNNVIEKINALHGIESYSRIFDDSFFSNLEAVQDSFSRAFQLTKHLKQQLLNELSK